MQLPCYAGWHKNYDQQKCLPCCKEILKNVKQIFALNTLFLRFEAFSIFFFFNNIFQQYFEFVLSSESGGFSSLWQNTIQPFPTYRFFLDTSAADFYWKQCDKRINCSKQAISSFATTFSFLVNDYTFIYKNYPFFCLNYWQSRLLACRCIVCVKRKVSQFVRNYLQSLETCYNDVPDINKLQVI